MEPSELLRFLVGVLERLHIRYLVTGSMATIYYGEPRLTNDIDIVAQVSAEQAERLCVAFPPSEFYVDIEDVREAIIVHGQFNIIHPASGLKIDVMIPDASAFNQSRFARAVVMHPAPDYEASFAAAEDVIIKKLQYFTDGGSEKHLRDIAGVLRVSADEIDREYIRGWTLRLGVTDAWHAVLERLNRENTDRGD